MSKELIIILAIALLFVPKVHAFGFDNEELPRIEAQEESIIGNLNSTISANFTELDPNFNSNYSRIAFLDNTNNFTKKNSFFNRTLINTTLTDGLTIQSDNDNGGTATGTGQLKWISSTGKLLGLLGSDGSSKNVGYMYLIGKYGTETRMGDITFVDSDAGGDRRKMEIIGDFLNSKYLVWIAQVGNSIPLFSAVQGNRIGFNTHNPSYDFEQKATAENSYTQAMTGNLAPSSVLKILFSAGSDDYISPAMNGFIQMVRLGTEIDFGIPMLSIQTSDDGVGNTAGIGLMQNGLMRLFLPSSDSSDFGSVLIGSETGTGNGETLQVIGDSYTQGTSMIRAVDGINILLHTTGSNIATISSVDNANSVNQELDIRADNLIINNVNGDTGIQLQCTDGNNCLWLKKDGTALFYENVTMNQNLVIEGNLSVKRPYGMFASTETQTIAVANTPYPITFNYTEDDYQIYKSVDNANFSFGQTGDYLIELSAVIVTDTNNKHLEIWLRKNNVNIPRSNTRVEIENAGTEQVIAVPFIIDMNMTDKFTVMWASDDAGSQLLYTTNTSYSPSTPSIIMTASKISEITE